MSYEQKSAFAELIAAQLKIQLVAAGEKTMDSEAGGPKPKAIGYVYGYVDAALRTAGWDMTDAEIGIPILFHVLRGPWPGKERDYTAFLAQHLVADAADPVVVVVCMHGGQQFLDWMKAENSSNVPMGLARYILTEV